MNIKLLISVAIPLPSLMHETASSKNQKNILYHGLNVLLLIGDLSSQGKTNKTAIAPTASISIICGGASPGVEPIAANSYTHKTLSGSFNVKNRYLEEILESHGKNDDETWSSITTNQGSISHLDFLTDLEKDVFKTAFELNQNWIIELSGDRTPFISQAQSVNLFLPADVHKKELHKIHFDAWKKGLKSLYYCRSKSIQRAENINDAKSTDIMANVYKNKSTKTEETEYEECLSCQ